MPSTGPVKLLSACSVCRRGEGGLNRNWELDRALDELTSGRLPLTTDPEVRSLVRLAMDVRDVRNGLTPERRAALKLRVLRRLASSRPRTFAERLPAVATLASRPLPLLSRAGTIALVVIALVGGASAVSADSLPDDPLYSLKLNSEQVRLSLAQNAADRAAVELGIAETRLREVTALTAQNRDAEADAAASSFGEYLANAAASIEEASSPQSSDLVRQLRTRVAQQESQLGQSVLQPMPNAVSVIVSVAQEIAGVPSTDGSAIADAAARAAEAAATMAKTTVDEQVVLAQPRSGSAQPGTVRPTVQTTPRPTLSPEQRTKLQAAAKAAKQAAQRARAAAERAKKAAAQKSQSREATPAANDQNSDSHSDDR